MRPKKTPESLIYEEKLKKKIMFGKVFRFSWHLFKFGAVVFMSALGIKAAAKGLSTSFGILADDIDFKVKRVKEA